MSNRLCVKGFGGEVGAVLDRVADDVELFGSKRGDRSFSGRAGDCVDLYEVKPGAALKHYIQLVAVGDDLFVRRRRTVDAHE